MQKLQTTILATFDSTHDAIFCEKVFQEAFDARIVSLPNSISAFCGLAIEFAPKEIDEATSIIQKNNIATTLYLLNSIGFQKKPITLLKKIN